MALEALIPLNDRHSGTQTTDGEVACPLMTGGQALHDAGRVSQPTRHFAFRKLPQLQCSFFPAGRCPGGVRQEGRWSVSRFAKGQKGLMSLPAIAESIS